ncbi:hypothetical protein [Acidovorax sp. sic0104]|uniref:hypothetical protein n=1 Tax=Acidovorax sp. sic0104 TaxID=2854784 RepID=UPI001C45C43E|nr:hypothetical protein [Acidovorax sp. sic0104]MBV7542181.1 hypothetical protein [Acidovorax sp. sic0104]
MSKRKDQAEQADKAFADYDFGSSVEVTDTSGWEYTTPGDERKRKVFVETEREDDGPAPRSVLTFTVRFDPESGSLVEATAIDGNGQVWGAMSDRAAIPQTNGGSAPCPEIAASAMREYKVLGAHENGNFFEIRVEATDPVHAFGAAALRLQAADGEGDPEFHVALLADVRYELPGDSVVSMTTVLDAEQAEVFGIGPQRPSNQRAVEAVCQYGHNSR